MGSESRALRVKVEKEDFARAETEDQCPVLCAMLRAYSPMVPTKTFGVGAWRDELDDGRMAYRWISGCRIDDNGQVESHQWSTAWKLMPQELVDVCSRWDDGEFNIPAEADVDPPSGIPGLLPPVQGPQEFYDQDAVEERNRLLFFEQTINGGVGPNIAGVFAEWLRRLFERSEFHGAALVYAGAHFGLGQPEADKLLAGAEAAGWIKRGRFEPAREWRNEPSARSAYVWLNPCAADGSCAIACAWVALTANSEPPWCHACRGWKKDCDGLTFDALQALATGQHVVLR